MTSPILSSSTSSPSSSSAPTIDDKLIRSLLVPDSTAGQILFVQEGVALKGSASHDAQTYLGTLFVTSNASGSIYILWLPYSFVYYIDPALVSPATKQSLALDKANLPTTSSQGKPALTSDGHIPLSAMRAEWLFSQAFAFEGISRIRCKVTMRGKRVITFHRTISNLPNPADPNNSYNNNPGNFPLTFHDGGVDRLLAVLGSFATVQSAPGGSHDDYTVQHQVRSTAAVHSMSPSAVGDHQQDANTLQQFRDQMYTNNNKDNGKDTAKKVGQRMLSNLVGLVSRGGKFLAEAFLDDDDESTRNDATPLKSNKALFSNNNNNNNKGGEGSGDFDMMDPLQPIEEVKPHLKFPLSLPPRGKSLTKNQWLDCFDATKGGALDKEKYIKARNIVFEGGICDDSNQGDTVATANQVRGELWKYLLGVYPIDATTNARHVIDEDNTTLYESVLRQWTSIGPEQEKHFTAFRERRTAVDKDVARTDRTHAAFAEDHSDKLVAMRRLLLTYSFFNFDIGYCQGMSDLIAVLLLMYPTEADVFAVFRMLMVKCGGNFMNGEQHTMATQLRAVEVLTHAFIPPLYTHLQKQQATNMCFCFRWLLVLFKREFPVENVVKIWDVIFACPFSDRYEIIMTTALLRAASDQIIDHAMQFDELLKFSNSMCSGLNSVDELLRASSEFYSFCVQQYEWSQGKQQQQENNNNNNNSAAAAVASPSLKNNNNFLSDQDSKSRKANGSGETRPSIRDLVEAFDIK